MTNRKLSIEGGQAAFPDGPPSWPRLTAEIESAVQRALSSGDWGRYDSEIGHNLLAKLAQILQVENVQLCSSGTIAVELALRGVGVRAGDEVIMAAYDFPGNFRAVEAIGARPVLIDVEKNGWSIDLEQVPDAKSETSKALLVSHLHGQTVDMKQAKQIAEGHQLKLVEDACQSPGGTIDGVPLGSFGDAAALSFGGSKLLSAGRGGAALFHNGADAQRAKIFNDRGNEAFPLSQLQSAVLIPQLETLTAWTQQRATGVKLFLEHLAGRLQKTEAGFEGCVSFQQNEAADTSASSESLPGIYKVGLLVSEAIDRSLLVDVIRAEGVAVGEGFRGFYKRSQRRCRKPVELPNATTAVNQTVLFDHPFLLSEPTTLRAVADVVVEALEYVLSHD